MITAAAWVPRGRAAEHPTRYDFSQDEIERIAKLAQLRLDDAKEGLESARKATDEDDDDDEEDGDLKGGAGEVMNGKKKKKRRNKSNG